MRDEFETILPGNSTPYERAVEQASGERWDGVDVDIIRRFQDPWYCPPHLLNFLAHQRSVDIWDESWPELKKRSVIASALVDHRMKGTLAGTRRYVEIADAVIKQVVRRPQGFSVSRNLTKAEQDAWIAKHPKVRLTLSQGQGTYRRRRGLFVGHAAVGVNWLKINEGRALYGRKAYLSRDGVEIPLMLSTVVTTEGDAAGTKFERLVMPGKSQRGLIVGRAAVGRCFVGSVGRNPQVFSFVVDRSYLHRESALALSTLAAGYQPRDVRTVRESELGQAGCRMFVGHSAIGRSFVGRNRAAIMIADVLYLHDPLIAVPRIKALSFVGHTRISMPHHQAELLVDWQRQIKMRWHFVVGRSAPGRQPVFVNDTTRRDFLVQAVASSKRLSDHVRLSFQITRARTLAMGTPLDGSVILGDRAPNRL